MKLKNIFKRKPKIPTHAELCQLARFSTDQLEAIGAVHIRFDTNSFQWGWVFPDGSKGFYDEHIKFRVWE